MTSFPHGEQPSLSIGCGIITVSDTRTTETDISGQIIQTKLSQAGHHISFYTIVPDEPQQVQALVKDLAQKENLAAIIINGGTGIAPRDTTYEAIANLLEKTLPGFGEIFRYLSYQEIGSRAIASRAIAGIYQNKLIFSLPGSSNGVKLALEQLILPELVHLTRQINL